MVYEHKLRSNSYGEFDGCAPNILMVVPLTNPKCTHIQPCNSFVCY